MIKAIIFDLDGTLYPRTNSLYISMSLLIRQWFQSQLRISNTDMDGYYEQMKCAYPSPLQAIRDFRLSVLSFHHSVFGRLDPQLHLAEDKNIQHILGKLSGKKFVVTLASYGYAMNVLKVLGIMPHISGIIVNGDDWQTTKKLDAYEIIRQKNGWRPGEVCVVGDDPHVDLLEAHAMGYQCVHVSDNVHLSESLSIGSLRELST